MGGLEEFVYGGGDVFHKPARGAGGAGYVDGVDAEEPVWVDLGGVGYETGVVLHMAAIFAEVVSVGAVGPAYEEKELDGECEVAQFVGTVGDASAEGVEDLEVV